MDKYLPLFSGDEAPPNAKERNSSAMGSNENENSHLRLDSIYSFLVKQTDVRLRLRSDFVQTGAKEIAFFLQIKDLCQIFSPGPVNGFGRNWVQLL